ncbi:MAG: helix-turn-helix domain-containing protein [Candidatus Eremiobacteraeota bacterium]|nr:helix-turn-helix domain-containing protein [Candidatus Eremiobacteraeota bacterium]
MEDEGRISGSSDFGTLLRHHRLSAGLSQEALAERARMSINGISALERGYRRTPQRETLAALASALELTQAQQDEFEAAAVRPMQPRYGAARLKTAVWSDGAAVSLPLALTSFVNREKELGEIAALLHEHRLVTLTGPPGIGKTQTALQVATDLEEANGQIYFVGLAPAADAALVTAAIASAVGVQLTSDEALLKGIVRYLGNSRLLLILDNCEHVIAEAARVAETLLTGCPHLRILATGREPLRAAGEHAYRLPSLSVPPPAVVPRLTAAEATAHGAIALFVDRARAVDHRFAVTNENAPTVARLCRRVDGIPLAIELAAARVNHLSLEVLSEKLNDSLRLLTGGERIALPRQQTMRATIDWSYNLLSPAERSFFERLSVFAGGCTIEAASAVCAGAGSADIDVLGSLSSLVDKSLVVADLTGNEPRYQLLESFREYAHEKLLERGEERTVTHRHALTCLDLAERLERAYDCEADGIWQELARAELDNWRAALRWTLGARGDVLLGQRLVGALRVLWQYFAPREGSKWLVSALALIDERTPADVLGSLSYAEAIVAWAVRDHKAHLVSSERAIGYYQTVGDALGVARAQTLAGHALVSLGRAPEARPLLHEALTVARETHSRRLVAYIVRCLGWDCGANLNDVIGARSYIAEALQIYESIGAKFNAAFTLNDLGECEACAGNLELALRYASEAVAALRSFKNMPLVAQALDDMALYLIALDRYTEAEAPAREVLVLARDHHLDVLAAQALQHFAAIAALRAPGNAESALSARARAARILGFVDARFAAKGSARLHNQEQEEYNRVIAVLREASGGGAIASLMAAGAEMTEEQAVAEALA